MIGVSPAYFVSRYGETFSPSDVAGGLAELAEMGYEAFQLEAYRMESLTEWARGGAQKVADVSRRYGMSATQFVAHFLLDAFGSSESLGEENTLESMQQVVRIVSEFPECDVITIPLGPFSSSILECRETVNIGAPKREPAGREWYGRQRARFVHKLRELVQLVERVGLRLALELLPGAFIAGTDGLLCLFAEIASPSLGFNFDTGHANACRENLSLIPAKLESRIFGTHLSDNFGAENAKLCPGDGGIGWDRVLSALFVSGYRGSFDVEIQCDAHVSRDAYGRAHRFIEAATQKLAGLAATGENGMDVVPENDENLNRVRKENDR